MSTAAVQPEAAPETKRSDRPLGEMEIPLHDLRSTAGLLLHIATSEYKANPDELFLINNKLLDCHKRIEDLWQQALDKQREENEAHKAKLEQIEKARAFPGSPDDVTHADVLWRMLNELATIVHEQVSKRAELRRIAESGRT